MKQLARLLACLGIIAGCQRGSGTSAPPVSEAYRQDIMRLCDVAALSGTAPEPSAERTLAIATWLSDHLQTQDAHDFLVRIQPLDGEPKAAALDAEAGRVGLASCALAAEWRTDPGH